ncbi:MAG: ribosomal protein S18-alanine N-acetyltransferase [candidate division KSB1 bacterium]|nr:ribosomal protein S18-alanine N-acetyltransferase [candidate division KSB1 bacterium]
MLTLRPTEGTFAFNGCKARIRPMVEADLDAVVAMEEESFTDPWSREAFLYELSEGKSTAYVVVLENGTVVAYLVYRILFDEMHILNIAVAQAYRRRGIAYNLLNFFIDRAKEEGLTFLYLEVRESNASAINLYKKIGFQVIGRRKFYYFHPQEDALVMAKKL